MYKIIIKPKKPSIEGTKFEWLNNSATVLFTPFCKESTLLNFANTIISKTDESEKTSSNATATSTQMTQESSRFTNTNADINKTVDAEKTSSSTTVTSTQINSIDQLNTGKFKYAHYKARLFLPEDLHTLRGCLDRNKISYIDGKTLQQLATQYDDLYPDFLIYIQNALTQFPHFDLSKNMLIFNLPKAVGINLFEKAQHAVNLSFIINTIFKSHTQFELIKSQQSKENDKFFLKGTFDNQYKDCLANAVKKINNKKIKLVTYGDQPSVLLIEADNELDSIIEDLTENLSALYSPNSEKKSNLVKILQPL
jgi:hypothetical protein